MILKSTFTAVAILLGSTATVWAQDTITFGGLANLEGPFAALGQDGIRGIELALKEAGGSVAGHKIELKTISSDGSPDSAINAVRRLVERDKVDIVIGPQSGSEGLAVKDYAKEHLDVTFINGSSAAQDTTLRDPAPNFFRFGGDGAQWQAGLGEYAAKELGYKKVAVVAEDYSFPYTMVQGFMLGFCGGGGHVPEKFWVPIGTRDFSSIVYAMPEVDAIYVALGGADAVNFLTQYNQAGGTLPLIGSAVTVDQTILDSKGPFRKQLVGMPSATPVASSYDGSEWDTFVASYRDAFPDGLSAPGIFATYYYTATKAALKALEETGGDLSNDHAALRKTLSDMTLETPTGPVKLDENRQGVVNNFLTKVVEGPDGNLTTEVVRVVKDVTQTLGVPRDEFMTYGEVGRDNPSCP